MVASLEGAKIKLSRATRHIAELNCVARAYLDARPFDLAQAEEPNGDLVWRIKMYREVPAEWSAIVGDIVHNIRSALDLVAWQLVELSGERPTRNTCFPIGQTCPSAYYQTLRRALAGASPAAVRLIRRLKAYAGGNPALTQLHALDITDKHRLVLVVGAAHKHVVVKTRLMVPWQPTPVECPPIALNPVDRQFPIQDGAEVFRICAAARNSEHILEHDLVFELAFGDVAEVRGLTLVETLESMHAHVSKIVKIIDRLFFQRRVAS